jgi:hypothetical protein
MSNHSNNDNQNDDSKNKVPLVPTVSQKLDKREKALRVMKAKKILASIGVESNKLGVDLEKSEINFKYTTYEEYLRDYEHKFSGKKIDDYEVTFEECD